MAFSGSALAGFNQGWRDEDRHQMALDQFAQQQAAAALDMDFTRQANPLRLDAMGLQNQATGINNDFAVAANPKRLSALDFGNEAAGINNQFARMANPKRLSALDFGNEAAGINNQFARMANPKRLVGLDLQNQETGIRNQSAALDFSNKQWAQPMTRAGALMDFGRKQGEYSDYQFGRPYGRAAIQMDHGNNKMNYELNQHAFPQRKQALDMGHNQAVRDYNLNTYADPYRYNVVDRNESQAQRNENYAKATDIYRYNDAGRRESQGQRNERYAQHVDPYRHSAATRQDMQGQRTEALAGLTHPYQVVNAVQAQDDAQKQRSLQQSFQQAQVTGDFSQLEMTLAQVFPDTDGKPDPVRIMPQADGTLVVENEGRQQVFSSIGELYQMATAAAGVKSPQQQKPQAIQKVGKDDTLYDPNTGKWIYNPNAGKAGALDMYDVQPGDEQKVVAQILSQQGGLSDANLAQGVSEVMAMNEGSPQANAYQYVEGVKLQQGTERLTNMLLTLDPAEIQQKAGVDLSDVPLTEYEAKTWAAELVGMEPDARQARLTELLKRKRVVETQRQMSEAAMLRRRYEGTDY